MQRSCKICSFSFSSLPLPSLFVSLFPHVPVSRQPRSTKRDRIICKESGGGSHIARSLSFSFPFPVCGPLSIHDVPDNRAIRVTIEKPNWDGKCGRTTRNGAFFLPFSPPPPFPFLPSSLLLFFFLYSCYSWWGIAQCV